MPTYSGGDAGIEIHPDFSKFVEELRGELDSVEANLGITIKPDTADADTQLQKWREENERDLGVSVDAKTDAADAELEKWRAEQEANPVKIPVKTDPASTKSASDSLKKDLASLKKDAQEASTLNLKVLGVVGAAGAVSDLLAIADAATQASRALALLPALGGGLLAGGAAAAIGAHGIDATFKAITAANVDPVQDAAKRRDALNSLAEAQFSVNEAERAEQTASRGLLQDEKDLNQAYQESSRSLRDMNLSLKEQSLTVSDAGIAVNEAAKNLQKIQWDPTADSDARQKASNDYQEAIIRWQQAQNKQNDLTADTAQANQLGVAGSQKVIDAQQKVTDGINAVADASHQVQQALVGVQKAQEQLADSSGQSKINSALAKLSPNAKELVQDVRDLGPAWTDARLSAQDALTNGMGPAVDKLANTQLPVFKKGITDIDTALNTGLRSTIAELSTDASKANFTTFLGNTASGFANAANAAAPLTQAMTVLATAGSTYLPQLGQAVDDAAVKFDNLILRTSGNGQLEAWLKQGITSGKELAQTAEHIGSAVASVFRAADSNGSVLKSLDDLSARMATFLKSAQGQGDLSRVFQQARAEADKFVPVLKDLPGLLQGVGEGTKLWADIALPFLHETADLLKAHPRLVELAVAAYVGFKSVKPAVDGAKLAIDYLAKAGGGAAEGSGGLGKLKAASAGLLGVLGNPWTLAITGAVTGLLTFEESADKDSAAMDRFKAQTQAAADANTALQKALQTSAGALDGGVIDAETQSIKGLRDAAATNAKDIPGFLDAATAGIANLGQEWFGVGGGILSNYDIRKSVDQDSKAMAAAFDQLGLSNDQLSQRITGSKPAFDQVLGQLDAMGSGGQDAAAKLQELRDEWAIDAAAVTPVAAAVKDLGDKNKDAASSIDAATQALERQRQGGLTLEDSTLKVNEALTAMGTGAQTAGGATITASGAIDTTSAAGQQLYQLINQQLVPAWEQETSAAYRNAIQHGQTAQQAQQAAQQTSDSIRDSAVKSIESMGYSQSQADELLKHYQPLAQNFTATFNANVDPAMTAVQQYEKLLDDVLKREGSIPGGLQYYAYSFGLPGQYSPSFGTPVTPTPTPGVPSNVSPFFPAHKTGGLLNGPGTGTSDSMMIRASTGEFVESEAAVDRYGAPFFQALNEGRIDPKLIALLPGYATGGLVGTNGTLSPTGPGVSRTPQLIAYAQSLAGQPYGGALDCSGLVSKIALDAAGLPVDSGRMSTANEGPWLGALGWALGGTWSPGVLAAGWVNDPAMPGGGHTALTLPDGENLEASGSAGKVLIGPKALAWNASLFNQHASLNMTTASVNTAQGGLGAPEAGTLATPTPGVTSVPVVNPQVPAPTPLSDQQLQVVQDRAAFDQANSQRNAVYADPRSTQQDKTAADYAYDKAANTLGSAMQQQSSGAATLFSAQGAGTALGIGIGSVIGAAIGASIPGGQGAAVNAGIGGAFGNKFGGKLGGILAGGLLSSLGLDKSAISEGNTWNQAFQQGIAASGAAFGSAGAGFGALGYMPKNLPSVVTTTTEQPTPTNPGTASYAGIDSGATTSSGIATNKALEHAYIPGAGAEQWFNTAQGILQATGRNVADAGITVQQIQDESGGNPTAVNNWDSNAAAGHPSKGLLQLIDTTFATFQDPRFPGDVVTPTANIAAGLNYVDSKYGGPEKIWPTTAGYADGGWVSGPGGPRTDSIPMLWWGSNGEYLHVTNAAGAQQNAAFLDAMNAGARFQPLGLPSSYSPGDAGGGEVHNHYGTVNVENPQIMHMGEFMDMLNQHQAKATLGSMAAWPV